MQLKQFMTPNPYGIQANEPGRQAAEQMRRHGFGALPVFEHDRLAGMITDRDLAIGCMAAAHDSGSCAVKEHMTADPVSIEAEASLEDALSKMAQEQVRRLIVMDGGRAAGIVSIGDLAVQSPDNPQVARTLAQISEPIRVPLRG